MSLATSVIGAVLTKDVGCVVVRRKIAALGVLCWAAAYAAAQPTEDSLVMPAPPDQGRLRALLAQRYPELLEHRVTGTPVVIALFGADGQLVRTALESRSSPATAFTASEGEFERFGHLTAPLRYVGLVRLALPTNMVVVMFGGLGAPELDRALVERYLPRALAQGTRAVAIWILFDHEGRVLLTGEESVETHSLRPVLEARFPGIRIAETTVTPVVGKGGRAVRNASGAALQLHCIWLEAGARLPQAQQ